MQLIINTYAAYLSYQGNLFQIKAEGKTSKVFARRVQSILIVAGVPFILSALVGQSHGASALYLAAHKRQTISAVIWPINRVSTRGLSNRTGKGTLQ